MSDFDDDFIDDARISVPRAAKMLGVSPTVMHELLDKGRIPYETPHKQRRVSVAEVAKYRARRTHRARTRETIEDLLVD